MCINADRILEITELNKNMKINATCFVLPFYTVRKLKTVYVAHTVFQRDSTAVDGPPRTVCL